MASYRQNQMLATAARAPDFQLTGLDGQRSSLRELISTRPALVAFYKTTCPVCQLAFPYLERIHRGQGERTISISGISQADAEATAELTQEFRLTFPVLLRSEEIAYS